MSSSSRWVLVVVALLGSCGGKAKGDRRPQLLPVPVIAVGSCGRPDTDGVLGPAPQVERADRDLSGDGRPEMVVVDRKLCSAEGNCYWNVFVRGAMEGEEACDRYAGTLSGSAFELTGGTGQAGMADVRGYWKLTGGERVLVQDYRFVRGGYQVTDALLCRREADDRLLCAEDHR